MKKVYRSLQEKQLAGVLEGLIEMYNIDVNALRIITGILGLATNGTVVGIYIMAAVAIPTDKEVAKKRVL